MPSNYPTSIDSFPDPLANSPLNAPSHSALHQDVNDAVEKIEVKLGLGSSPASGASAGQVLVANGSGNTAWSNVPSSFVICTSTTRPTPVEGIMIYETDTNRVAIFNGVAWVSPLPLSAVNIDITPSVSASYTNASAAVSILTGTSAWVTLTSQGLSTSSGSTTLMSFAVSGATTIAASDANSVSHIGASVVGKSRTILVSSLNAGLNTFTIASRASGVGGLIDRPAITVVGVL